MQHISVFRTKMLFAAISALVLSLFFLIFSPLSLAGAVSHPHRLAEAVQKGKWPAQTAASRGNIRPDRHGPQRNDPAEGIPEHAYSPFAERVNREHPCPPGGCEFEPGEVLVKLAPGVRVRQPDLQVQGALVADAALNKALQAQGIVRLQPIFTQARPPKPGETVLTPQGGRLPKPDLTRWYRADLSPTPSPTQGGEKSVDVYKVVEALSKTPGIAWAEPNYLRKLTSDGPRATLHVARSTFNVQTFNDPLYAQQWHLPAVHAEQAWNYLASQGLPPGGNRDIVVAVIDTGVDYTHPDLAANMWTNSLEIPGNGVDDDHNGFVDDVHGVNVVSTQHSGNPMDNHGHGTHVAGIIAAQANNGTGGVGVAYNVQIMAIKAAQYSGVLSSSDIAEAIDYAVAQGADVINMSFGGYSRSQLEEDALAVAFGQAVLVAAAGNDGVVNLPCPLGRDMYPAAYNWVLGVMASTRNGNRAGFSNYDCTPNDTHEYEVMAPGVDVWSTLPEENYAAWDGTSMATPIVSGIAALARTKWANKDVYSSRFIMGQIAANTQGGVGGVADAYAALTVAPQPELSYLEHWLFDTAAQDPIDDDDGIVDAGETIDLAIVIRNQWGKADPVTVTLEAIAEGAYQPDPYVTMITDTVSYGAIGSFNQDDNGLIYDDQGVITGVRHPFRFSVDSNTPNDHVIPFKLTMTAGNGYASNDPNAPYTFVSRFYLIVQRGRELPRIIDQDMLLTKDYYWIVPGQTLIESGFTVTVTKGTQVQWGAPDPSNPYGGGTTPYIQVEGTLLSLGTYTEPVEMFPSDILGGLVSVQTSGRTELNYVRVSDPEIGRGTYNLANLIDRGEFYGDRFGSISAQQLSNSIIRIRRGGEVQSQHLTRCLFDRAPGSIGYYGGYSIHDTVFLQDNPNNRTMTLSVGMRPHYQTEEQARGDDLIRNNAFLSKYWDPDSNHWMRLTTDKTWCCAGDERTWYYGVTRNYWGTTSTTLIDAAIFDFNDDFNKAHIVYQPILTTPATTTYPFVVDVFLSTEEYANASALHGPTPIVGAEPVTFTVTFNRDMDTSVQPAVSFGPDVPETDYTIHPIEGGWRDARTWVGSFNVNPITGDGYQLLRIAGPARAADDPWLVIGDDTARFRFEIITSGTEAMNLQATGGEGYVDLMWTQDDFDLLAGFNLYRATSSDGPFTRINQGLIPQDQRTYRDTNVQPGQPYYYKFTVVKTDMSESDFSNVANATPIDTIPPVIQHTPVTDAPPGLPLTLFANVTDNVGVQDVTLYYRAIGASGYFSSTMTHTSGNRYSATIAGARVTSPGLEYYIEATDGVSVVQFGRPAFPYQVTVTDRPVVTAVSPIHGPASGGTDVTIAGSNFKAGASVTFGGAVASNVTLLSSSQITCTTPAHFPEMVDVVVTNPDGQSGTLLRGFTYESDVATLSLPDTGGGQYDIVQVPLGAVGIQGMLAADITITFDPAVLSAQGASTGSLTPNWTLVTNTTTPGQITLSMANTSSVTGSGVLANLEFEIIGSPGVTTTLHFASAMLNDGAIPVTTADGFFSVNLVYDVSGTIHFWNGGVVSSTLLSLEGDRVYTGQSHASGAYIVSGAAAGAYTLTPSKSDDINGITAYDASLVLQHAAGLITLGGYAAIAADVNKSGTITAMDAAYILQKAVDLITLPFPGAGVVWDFDPQSRSYANLSSNLTGQDFTAVLLGDVSGNWSAGALAASAPDVAPVRLILEPGSMPATAVIKLDPARSKVYALDMRLSYDATTLKGLSIDAGPLAQGILLSSHSSEPSQARIALAGATPLTRQGTLLTLHWRSSPGQTMVVPSLVWAQANEGAIPIQVGEGEAILLQLYLPTVVR